MSEHRRERLIAALSQLTAGFLQQHAGPQSLITVTGLNLSSDGRRADVLLSVYPVEKEQAALDFARRQLSELRQHVKKNLSSRAVPRFSFEIDQGEKNRQRVEELLK
ncbi:MAG: ribosome-binding factor A [Patescibacteria group bacterium]|nr:ribosome-binding factor A [Patescibacteria group bacterium]